MAGVISLVSLALMIALAEPADPSRVYTGTDTRAFSLLLGAVVAAPPVRSWVARVPARYSGLLAVLMSVAIAGLWLAADGNAAPWLFTGGLFVHSLLSALLIVSCAELPRGIVARLLEWGPLRWLGGISYSLYLWHWPVTVALSPEVFDLAGWWPAAGWRTTAVQVAAVWAVSIALATASTYLLENPIRFRASWARGRTGAYALVATTLLLASLWLLPPPAPTEIDLTTF